MDIKIPTSLTQFELYSMAKRVISDYSLEYTNLNEYPIRVFNKVNEVLGIPVDAGLTEELERVFVEKGSFNAVKKYLKYLDMDSEITLDEGLNMVIHLGINQVTNLDFIKYLPDAISYLIFFNDLRLTIDKLISFVELPGSFDVTGVGLNIVFSDIVLEDILHFSIEFDEEFQ